MNSELYARLLEDATRYDPAQHTRSLLAPYRDVLLMQRAKFMSYEQISATLARHGLKVSPAAVGCFCRRHLTKSEIDARRKELTVTRPPAAGLAGPRPAAASAVREVGKRGPRIARDHY